MLEQLCRAELERGAPGRVRGAEVILEGDVGPWGPVVQVQIRAQGGKTMREGIAILDTGARLSVIDAGIAKSVGASVVGSHMANGVCGSCKMHKYRLDIHVGGVDFTEADLLGKPDLAPQFVALLGEDFLKQGVLVVDGPKKRFRFTADLG